MPAFPAWAVIWHHLCMADLNVDDIAGDRSLSGLPPYAARDASLDSEIDFDDEQEDDQLPLDEVEAREVGALLDDPDALAEEEEQD